MMKTIDDDPVAKRAMQMAQEEFDDNLKQKIIARMKAENAKDLSDAEIDRTLSGCVAPWLGGRAKMFRDCNFMTVSDLDINV